jgi:hypothetical protein
MYIYYIIYIWVYEWVEYLDIYWLIMYDYVIYDN